MKALAKLGSGSGGRSRVKRTNVPWNLDCQMEAEAKDTSDLDDEEDDDEIVASEGSSITLNNSDSTTIIPTSSNGPASLPNAILALQETPERDQKKKRKAPVDCHVLIRWSALQELVTKNMACATCGTAITRFVRRTVGIATELDFDCRKCKTTATAHALRSEYELEKDKDDFIRRERRINFYELNYRLILATQLMGESQIGGSILGLCWT
jgi:ribosomal protein L37AE/L43A